METKNAIAALTALASSSRLGVYRLLVQAGPEGMTAGNIAEATNTPASTLSFHLKELGHAGLVTSRQEGRFVIYSASYATMNELIGFLTENCCQGESCAVVPASDCTTCGDK
ncbi:metalloregulator ArsR/SmtB family transcription factor [Cupriavidus sp. WKF15]|uniref:ArsR/SmtB family transcription factor n=1 Tax=Cupriavidus sp. WKF15 TaxID=3032282 RepID=UPI0023E34E87|nr:metalloregulator ArsR/SmtB family transcription factor [Cupriavidus sp. WKF15]WER49956.1 metalloregulator ArsR/SmtB family transcription factor [Cupriavidus sp. WKF15]